MTEQARASRVKSNKNKQNQNHDPGKLLPHRYPKYKSKSYIFLYIKATVKGLTITLLTFFGITDYTCSNKDMYFTFQNAQYWVLAKGISCS